MHLALVTNPRSGGTTDPDRITTQLTRHGCEVELITLEDIAGGLPQRASAVDRLVVAGGDGSIGVTALAAHGAGLPLAVVPTGTANDFARALGLPSDVERACALAADRAARTRHQEIGRFCDHPFVNAASAGLSVHASRYAGPHKSRLGPMAYPVGAARAALSAPTLHCRVRCDGEECFAGEAWQLVVGVTGAFGGGSRIGGTAHDDGRLDVAVVPAGPRPSLVRRALGMRRGRLTAQRDVGHHRAHVVEVELPRRTPFNVDGDVRECEPARFDLVPGGVEVVVP